MQTIIIIIIIVKSESSTSNQSAKANYHISRSDENPKRIYNRNSV